MKRLAILISGRGSNMARLASACTERGWPARIVGVIADRPEAAGIATARGLGLPVEVLAHASFDGREAFDAALAARLDALEPDFVLLAGFMRILSEDFVRHFDDRLVNIHPSLLPAFTGLRTHERALEAGVRVHGATVHGVTAALDQGPILAQAVVPVRRDDDAASLAARVLQAEHRLYPAAVEWLVRDRLRLAAGRVAWTDVADPARLLVETAP